MTAPLIAFGMCQEKERTMPHSPVFLLYFDTLGKKSNKIRRKYTCFLCPTLHTNRRAQTHAIATETEAITKQGKTADMRRHKG